MDSLELKPLVHLLQHNGGCWRGGFLVFLADNLGNLYRINKGRARHVTRAHELLRELYALADGYDIEFIALWLPCVVDSSLDAPVQVPVPRRGPRGGDRRGRCPYRVNALLTRRGVAGC